MKSRGLQSVFVGVLMVMFASLAAYAQDAGMSDVEITDDRTAGGGGDVVFTADEMGGRYAPGAAGVMLPRDSVALQMKDFPMLRAAQKPADKTSQNSKQKDDSVLTYNFLYYIIQKYKLQDIID